MMELIATIVITASSVLLFGYWFRYEKYRTKFAAAGEPGMITLDETPIGVFLELEGAKSWIDGTAGRLGFALSAYSTASYAALYTRYREQNKDAPANMTFE